MYQVVYPDAVLQKLKTLHVVAAEQGRGVGFQKTLLKIHRKLSRSPRSLGEIKYSHHHAKIDVYMAVAGPLVVYWGVHREKDIVFVKDFELT